MTVVSQVIPTSAKSVYRLDIDVESEHSRLCQQFPD